MSGELMLEFCPKQLIRNHGRFLYIRKAFKSIVGYRFRAGINLTAVQLFQAQCVHHYCGSVDVPGGTSGGLSSTCVHKLVQRLDLCVQLYNCSKHSVCTTSIDENAVVRSIDI